MGASNIREGKNRLYRPRNLVIRKVDDFFLALNPDIPNIMVVDDVGKRLLELCDGKLRADEVVERLVELEGGVSRKELFDFISSMVEAGFLFLRQPAPPRKINYSFEYIRELYLHITRACNLRCRHCYVEAGDPLESELTTDEVINLVKDFAKLGGERLIITGGEPLLRRETLYEAIRAAREAGVKEIFVETNGTLLSDEDAKVFKKYDVELGVSLDGAVKETNDYIRGERNYEKTINTIKRLLQAGVNTRIGFTLMKHNIKEVDRLIYLAKDLGVSSLSIKAVLEIGRAEKYKNLLLSLEEVYPSILEAWRKAKELGINTEFEDQIKDLKERLTRKDSCGAGKTLISVSSDGYVYPCNMFLGMREFNAGNLRKQKLEDIWKNSEALKTLRRICVLDIKGCSDCEMKFICSVCLATVYKEHKSFSEKPRDCNFQKKFLWVLVEDLARRMWNEISSGKTEGSQQTHVN